ncbi:immunoglobulin lambda-1 light chain isoform X6 [Danio rerio]|uniref:immunoglobulin lambda-1 light chain isoform X6 n=1 Tax=Danio rerio TaxID=7955 RepID=UPI003CE469B7
MCDLLCLILLCLISPKVMAGTVSQFPPSVKVRSGETVSMLCQMSEVKSFCHTVAWVRVHPVSGVIDILQDTKTPHESKDLEENTVCQAFLFNATVQDSGTYYCIATDRDQMYLRLGNGTAITVQADSTEMASIEIMAFTSSNNHDPTVTLQCTLSGFAPSQVSMYWLIGSRRENGQTLFVWDEGKENSVKTQNYVDISEEEWKTGTESTCIVNLGGRTFTKTLNHDDIQETCYPVISPQSLKNFPDAIFHLRFRTATAN